MSATHTRARPGARTEVPLAGLNPGASMNDVELQQLSVAHALKSVYVYQTPVRLWHWVNALAIVVLCITGYLIGSPLPSPGGEASEHFMMGYVRFLHFAAGYTMAISLLGRTYWALVGNYYAKELFWVPLFQAAYWQDVWSMVKWYAFVAPRPGQFIGHNPLARFSMFFLFLVPSVFMVLTGFAMYAEGQGAGTWQEAAFGWVIPLFGQSQDVHTWHHMMMWVIVCFVIVHIYSAVREEILGRTSMISTMVSGHRSFKD